jgi:hypothetical protein
MQPEAVDDARFERESNENYAIEAASRISVSKKRERARQTA